MPYFISNTADGCPNWATVKHDGSVITCHKTKKQAVDHMVALSLAENIEPGGELKRATGVNRALICDIDDTLIHNNRIIADVNGWVQQQEMATLLVTGRLNKYRDFTVEQLSKLGIDYDQLIMNDLGSTSRSVEFKKATAERLLKLYDVVYAVDNDGGAREAYASLGIEAIDPAKLPVRRDMTTITNSPNMAAPSKQDLSLRLADLLGDVVVFKFMAHGFHWNVRGINFSQYHEFFGEIYEDADSSIDPIAENIRKLGFNAPFRLQDFIESENENEPTDTNDPVEMARSLYIANQDVIECIVHAIACADELEEQGILNFLAERQDMHQKWEWQLRSVVGDDFANAYAIDITAIAEGTTTGEGDEGVEPISTQPKATMQDVYTNPDGSPIVEQNSAKTKWVKAAEMIVRRINPTQEIRMPESRDAKFETRVSHADIELREVQGSNGMTFEGYAAVFNSPSQPIGGQFTEFVAPGAFKRSLQARNDIKLLWNHDTGQVLGSTRAGTLTLTEDSRGLKAIANLPDTQLGRDTATLLKRGDVAGMSFGFTVPKNGDSWSDDGTRTLHSVRLHEVSITAFPAYDSTSAQVRSIDVSDLAESLFKLEQGENLTADEANLVRNVVDKLTEDIKDAPAENILDLKQKKLELLAKRI
jgi:HK97 family phage prohead protease